MDLIIIVLLFIAGMVCFGIPMICSVLDLDGHDLKKLLETYLASRQNGSNKAHTARFDVVYVNQSNDIITIIENGFIPNYKDVVYFGGRDYHVVKTEYNLTEYKVVVTLK